MTAIHDHSNAAMEGHMRQSDFGTSQAIERPSCPKCGARMMLARIEPDEPNHDKRTFECSGCQNSESVVVRYK
jgi:hypothetical protein